MQRITTFKILTLVVFGKIFFPSSTFAALVNQKKFKTHYRLELNIKKNDFKITKDKSDIILQTLDLDLFNKVVGELLQIKTPNLYFKEIVYSQEGFPNKPTSIRLSLQNSKIELFNFYDASSNKYVMDFWADKMNPNLDQKINQIVAKPKVSSIKKKVSSKKIAVKSRNKKSKTVSQRKVLSPKRPVQASANPGYRDFRYGAALTWDYKALIPTLERDISLKVKSPDYLYQIKDRKFSDDKKESHMQLTVNFYRKKDWGLMKRSIDLYRKKYGSDKNKGLNEFLETVALMQDNISDKNPGIHSAAMNKLINVIALSDEYDLKTASLRFVIQDSLDQKDYLKALKYAKQLYLESASNFDNDLTIKSSKAILYCLANLKQLDKITTFLSEKAVRRTLSEQLGKAYEYYVMAEKKDYDNIIKDYEKNKKTWAGLLHESVIFNAAEAYFNDGQYEKAKKLFDTFVANYSHISYGAAASRSRLGLIYDITEDDINKVIELYTTAIDRATDPSLRYEAKLRLAAIKLARKLNPTSEDLRYKVLLEKTPQENSVMNNDLNKLLWQVRLRSLINTKEYEKAIAYLESVPVENLLTSEKKNFYLDGAEIVTGLVQSLYEENNLSRATRVWELYKDKYSPKVAKSLYLNFIVADAYSQLGLKESYKRVVKRLESIQNHEIRNFPIWVEPRKKYSKNNFLTELDLLHATRNSKWDEVERILAKANGAFPNTNFYTGIVEAKKKNYTKAIGLFEKVLITEKEKASLTPEQTQQLVSNYSEILFKRDEKKFIATATAMLKDLENTSLSSWNPVKERLGYLYIEAISNQNKTNKNNLLKYAAQFLQKYGESTYRDRVNFIRAKTLVKMSRTQEAKDLLTKLMNEDSTSSYVKELARSELTMIELNNNSLQ
jgi:tetratricopeptide (TPR) repeat protein